MIFYNKIKNKKNNIINYNNYNYNTYEFEKDKNK